MTLKELLIQVGFDELLPHLKKREPKHLDNMYAFREAYDILQSMKPDTEFKGEIHVEWSGRVFECEEKWIRVGPMHDSSWEEDLAKEIVIADDVHLSPAELAMHCLWEITYWGFSPAERQETWQRKFGSKVSKRKREYRQDKRKEYLRKMAARENLVRKLSAEGSSFRRNEVEFLLHVQYGRQYDYRSVTSNIENRLDYIFESMTRYQQLDLSRYNSAVIFLQFPLGKPVDELSLNSFKQGIREWLGYTDIYFGSVGVETEAPDVNVTLLLSRRMEK